MQIGMTEARRRFSELVDRAARGEVVEVARRGRVVAVIGPPPGRGPVEPLAVSIEKWRSAWAVDDWPDDGPFAGVRDRSDGRPAPW